MKVNKIPKIWEVQKSSRNSRRLRSLRSLKGLKSFRKVKKFQKCLPSFRKGFEKFEKNSKGFGKKKKVIKKVKKDEESFFLRKKGVKKQVKKVFWKKEKKLDKIIMSKFFEKMKQRFPKGWEKLEKVSKNKTSQQKINNEKSLNRCFLTKNSFCGVSRTWRVWLFGDDSWCFKLCFSDVRFLSSQVHECVVLVDTVWTV